jgi:hypothetical protein
MREEGALIHPAEPTITIAGDDPVSPVTQRPWDQGEYKE